MNERENAVRILKKTLFQGVFLKDALFSGDEGSDRNERPSAFTERVVKGVIERKVLLDAILKQLIRTPFNNLDPEVHAVLLSGLYELYELSTEPYAVVSEHVNLVRKKGDRTKAFVNAVLRNALREKEALFKALTKRESLSFTPFLYEKLISWYGEEETERIGRWLTDADSDFIGVRRMVSKCSDEDFRSALQKDGIQAVPTGRTDDTYFLNASASLFKSEAYRKGLFYVQDLSSSLLGDVVSDLFAPETPDLDVFDACSSPGGKILHLYDLSLKTAIQSVNKRNDRFFAADVCEKKIEAIRANQRRLGFSGIETIVKDASVFDPDFRERFDLVLLDVPCSGLGVLKKKPDIQLFVDEERLKSLAVMQKKILQTNASYVKPGGTLLYSTCTINPEENELRIESFLSSDPKFKRVNEHLFLPGKEGTDGFYYARLFRSLT